MAVESELEKELTRRAKQQDDPQAKTLKLSFTETRMTVSRSAIVAPARSEDAREPVELEDLPNN